MLTLVRRCLNSNSNVTGSQGMGETKGYGASPGTHRPGCPYPIAVDMEPFSAPAPPLSRAVSVKDDLAAAASWLWGLLVPDLAGSKEPVNLERG